MIPRAKRIEDPDGPPQKKRGGKNLPALPEAPAVETLTDQHLGYPDVIPGILHAHSLNIFSAPTHGGKTTLIAQLIRCFQTGEPFFGLPVRMPAAIAYIALDHRWEIYQSLFTAVGVTEDGPPPLYHYARRSDRTPGVSLAMRAKLEKSGIYRVVDELVLKVFGGMAAPEDTFLVIDPLHPLTGKDINDHVKVGDSLTDLGQYASHKKVHILGTAHTPKIKANPEERYARAVDRGAGSTAMAGYSETTFNLTVPEETNRPDLGASQLTIVPRRSSARAIYIKRGEDGLFIPYEDHKPTPDVSRFDERSRTFGSLIPIGVELETKAVLKIAVEVMGVSVPTAERYLFALRDAGLVHQVRHGVWTRPREDN